MNQGKLFEILVTLLEETLKEKEYIEIIPNTKLRDNTGNLRQIDILLEIDRGLRLGKDRVIIECKDKSRKVSVGAVGSFIDLLQSVGCSKGVMVSRKGFATPAITKAEGTNGLVQLYTLSEISDSNIKSWMQGPISRFRWEVDINSYRFGFEANFPQAALPFNSASEVADFPVYNERYELLSSRFIDFVLKIVGPLEIIKDMIAKFVYKIVSNRHDNMREGILTIKPNIKESYLLNYQGFLWIPVANFTLGFLVKIIEDKNDRTKVLEYRSLKENTHAHLRSYEFGDMSFEVIEPSSGEEKIGLYGVNKESGDWVEYKDLTNWDAGGIKIETSTVEGRFFMTSNYSVEKPS